MATVGDIIMGFRELATDLPSTLAPPSSFALTPTIGSNPLADAVYYFVFTLVNQWGETIASSESSATTTGGNQNIVITQGTGPAITSGLSVRAYVSTLQGQEAGYFAITSFPFTYDSTVTPISQPVPSRNTAYLPDSDGQALGAYAAYRWLNAGLHAAASFAGGGIPDFGAVGTASGNPLYQLPGYWKKLDTAWYDGYPLYLARKNDVFRKSPVPGTVGALLVYQASDRLIVECWPQPSRTSGQTTLASPISASATSATLTSAASFALGFGLVQIGTEIMEYSSISGNTLGALTRGMSGTVPTAQLAGASVTELNLMVSGYRVPSSYAVGSSGSNLTLPPGWVDALKDYMLHRFREAEQDGAEASRLLKQFNEKMQTLRTNKIIAGPRQIQANAGRGAETMVGLGSPFGGIIVP